MAVNSVWFLILFPIILILYYVLPGSVRVYLLAMASLVMYSLWGIDYLCILLLVVCITYFSARVISRYSEVPLIRGAALWINVICIVCLLGSIRFLPEGSVIAPIGISFYSLAALGYVVDVYKGKIQAERNIIKYNLFVSFFPIVTSGPIQRSNVLLKQIHDEKVFDYEKIRSGLLMMAYGLFAKNFVADRLGFLVDKAYEGCGGQTGLVLLMGVILYAFQLYCDFMGYSCIAIGSAKALGFDLPDNFKQPYFSKSVKEFWGRWHISLSEWLRDYIYFPLGGSRKGFIRTLINIAIVFVISGIWHGRGLTFLVWGGLHGLYRIIEEIAGKRRRNVAERSRASLSEKLVSLFRIIWTFMLVDFAWLFFRAESLDKAFVIIRRIFTEFELVRTIRDELWTFGLAKKELLVWFIGLAVVIVIDFLHEKGFALEKKFTTKPIVFRWCVYVLFVAFMILVEIYYYGYSAQTFIYAGF